MSEKPKALDLYTRWKGRLGKRDAPVERQYLDMPMNYDALTGPGVVVDEDLTDEEKAKSERYFEERGVE